MTNIKKLIKSIPNFISTKFGILLINHATFLIIIDLVKILGLTKDHQLTISNLNDLIQLYRKHQHNTIRNKILKLYYLNIRDPMHPIFNPIEIEIENEWDELDWGNN